MSREYRSLLQSEGRDISDVSTAIEGSGITHRMPPPTNDPFLQEEIGQEGSTREEQSVAGQWPGLARSFQPGIRAAVGLRRRTLSPPPPQGSRQTIPISSSEDAYQTPQANSTSSRAILDPHFARPDTYDGGRSGLLREEEDISHIKTTTHFDEYELGDIRPEGRHVGINNDEYNDVSSMLQDLNYGLQVLLLVS